MKKILTFILCVLLVIPFIHATELSSRIENYNDAKEEFLSLKVELEECEAAGDDCEDIEEDILDTAIVRPGRLDRLINIPIPSKESRADIFKIHSKNMTFDKTVASELIVEKMEIL